MKARPKCIIVTGRPGSGKTTLTAELGRRLWMPRVSRDEVKEGYVNTFGVKHDQLPPETNGVVNEVFFDATLTLLRGKVSVVIEAAFGHKLWDLVVPRILQIASAAIILCDLDAETSARRHLQRGLGDPNREFYHGDRRVALYRQTGEFSPGGPYDPPHYDVPTLKVSTREQYDPPIEKIVQFVRSL
jgi:predicted kinase